MRTSPGAPPVYSFYSEELEVEIIECAIVGDSEQSLAINVRLLIEDVEFTVRFLDKAVIGDCDGEL